MTMPTPALKYSAVALTRGSSRRVGHGTPAHVVAARRLLAAHRELQRASTEARFEASEVRLLAAVDALRSLRLDVPHPLAEPATAAEAAVMRLERMRALVLAAIGVSYWIVGRDGATVRTAVWRLECGEAALKELRAAARLDANGPDIAARLAPGVADAAGRRDTVAGVARMLLRLIGG